MIRAYSQVTSVPSASQGGVPRAVSTRVVDWGAQAQRFGQTFAASMEPELRQRAIEQGAADFAAEGLIRDSEGNLAVPDADRGGLIYQASFRQAGETQYMLETIDQAEQKLLEIYKDPEQWGKDPDGMRKQAEDYVRGVISGAPQRLQQDLFRSLTSSIRQRDNGAANEYRSITLRRTESGLEAQYNKISQEIENAMLLEGDAAGAQLIELNARLDKVVEGLVPFRGAEWAENVAVQRVAVRGYGMNLRAIRELALSATPLELTALQNVIKGNDPRTIMGFDTAQFVAEITDPQLRGKLASAVGQMAQQRAAELNGLARRAESENEGWQTWRGSGQPTFVSDEKFAKGVAENAELEGVDLLTREGVMWAAENYGGDVPDYFYKRELENASAKRPEELERLSQVYDQLRNMVNPLDGSRGYALPPLNNADEAILHHFNLAMRNGLGPQEAKERAMAMVEQGLNMDRGEMRSMLARRSEQTGEEVVESLADGLGDWNNFTPEVRNYLTDTVSQLVAMGIDYDTAVERTQSKFQQQYTQDVYTGANDLGFTDKALASFGLASFGKWVRNEDAVPVAADIFEGGVSRDWVQRLGPQIAELAAQESGIPPIEDLVIGRDIRFQSLGVGGEKSKLFRVYYQGPETDGIPHYYKTKSGENLVLDLGRAAYMLNVQGEAANREINARASDVAANEAAGLPFIGFGQRLLEGAGVIDTAAESYAEDLREQLRERGNVGNVKTDWLAVERRGNVTIDGNIEAFMAAARTAESGGVDSAENPRSTATGRYQFIDSTWISEYRATYPNSRLSDEQILNRRTDGKTQDAVMRTHTQRNAAGLQAAGIPVTKDTLYGAHFLGLTAARSLFSVSRETSIASIVSPAVLRANPEALTWGGKPKTVGAVLEWIYRTIRK